MDNYDSLWEIANEAYEELKKTEAENSDKNSDKNSFPECEHVFNYESVCNKCGACMNSNQISREGEWNIYKDDSGNYAKNTQRADTYVDNNPYSKGGTLLPGGKNTFIAKLQIQQTFSHKQKTYWLVTTDIEHAASLLNINNKDIIETAKKYWHKYMESGN